ENQATWSNFGPTMGLSPWPSLNNSGDDLYLISADEKIIDFVSYSSNWYQNSTKKQGGWTLERIMPENNCLDASNWKESEDIRGGSPGSINSIYGLSTNFAGPQTIHVVLIDADSLLLQFSKAV